MNRFMQIYYNAIFGAIGGLIGWFVVGLFPTGDWDILIAYAFVGAGVGAFIGLLTGSVGGLMVQRSVRRATLGAVLGCIAGLASGTIGLLLGEGFFLILKGGLIGRSLGWTFLGLFLGMGDGLINLKMKRAGYGAVGGMLGGLAGGLVYESMTELFIKQSGDIQIVVGAIGVILIGACLGGIIPLSVELIAAVVGRGALEVLNGKRQGLVVSVIDRVTLGSYDGCEVYLPMDKGIAKKHALVYQGKGGFFAQDLGSAAGTFVGNRRVPIQTPGLQLRSGDQIRLGETLVRFKS